MLILMRLMPSVVCTLSMDLEPQPYKIFSWNGRGLNSIARHGVRNVIDIYKPDLICLQETKMEVISASDIRSSLGLIYQDNFFFLPAVGASGGIIIAGNPSVFCLTHQISTNHTISVYVHDIRRNKSWWFSRVYKPQGVLEKKMSLKELKQLNKCAPRHWLIMEDFNLIYLEEDKNYGHRDRALMHRRQRNYIHTPN
jgi:exonuclease III